MEATDGHTNEKPVDKRTCVRVRYARQYHVDLPAYAKLNGTFMLAEKGGTGWHSSDSKVLTEWFNNHVQTQGEQLRRIVRYLKAWADYQSQKRGKVPNGLILTVLATLNFRPHARDDKALADTLAAISVAIDPIFSVLNPVDTMEELTSRLSDTQKRRFQDAISDFASDVSEAINHESRRAASEIWQDQLGDRFLLLKLEIVPPGTRISEGYVLGAEAAVVCGIYRLSIPDSQRYIDYRNAILLPDNYPRDFPRMYCNDKKLPIGNIDRHIMNDGSACLGVNAEIGQKWRGNPRIIPFIDEIVAPFLVWQAYYDAHGEPPPWGERPHYAKGILEFYGELLHGEVDWNIKDFMELLARKNNPKGHDDSLIKHHGPYGHNKE